MGDELMPGQDSQLVEWEDCFIRPSLLTRIGEAVLSLTDADQMDDVRDALAEQLKGMDVISVKQISARIRRILKLK